MSLMVSEYNENIVQKIQTNRGVVAEKVGTVALYWLAITEANIQVVAPSPRKSVRKTAAACQLSKKVVHTIMCQCLILFTYRVQTKQPLQIVFIKKRKMFAKELLEMIDGSIDVNSVWFSDNLQFYLDGFINKHNWGTENPRVCVPRSLCSQKVTVWAAFSNRGAIKLFFFFPYMKQ